MAYDKACAKADGIRDWHSAVLKRIEDVYAAGILRQTAGHDVKYENWLLGQLHNQKLSIERDYKVADKAARIAWQRAMDYGKRWSS
jgi:hypothetical protein